MNKNAGRSEFDILIHAFVCLSFLEPALLLCEMVVERRSILLEIIERHREPA